jgi:ElaB/YqjD/DUF883 family membrane-anchored ribosome-binding protein
MAGNRFEGLMEAAAMAERKTLDEVEEKAGAAAQGSRERLSEVARGVEQRYQRVAEEMRREAERAGKVAREKVDTAVSGLRQGYGKMSKNVGNYSEDVTDYVRDNPGKSLLVAAIVGFVVGLLFRRRDD